MDSLDEGPSKEETQLIAEKAIKEGKEALALINQELKAYEKLQEDKQKFYDKFGFTEELIKASKNPPISEAELDEDVQKFFDHFLKELTANEAAQGTTSTKSKRTGIKLSRRGKMI